jgi:methanogenic corrinoid protein MtbC1
MITRVERLVAAVVALDAPVASAVVEEAFAAASAAVVCDELVRPALEEIGARWERGELSLANVFMGSKLCERALDEHLPPSARTSEAPPRIAIGVFEDQHQLGKRMVLASLRSAGLRVLDYGGGLRAAGLVARLEKDGIQVLLLSTLMLRSALAMSGFIAELRRSGSKVRVVVGGAPFRLDPTLAARIGADAWGATASDALRLVTRLAGPISAPLLEARP